MVKKGRECGTYRKEHRTERIEDSSWRVERFKEKQTTCRREINPRVCAAKKKKTLQMSHSFSLIT